MNAGAVKGTWEEPITEKLKLVIDTHADEIAVHIDGKEVSKYTEFPKGIFPTDIGRIKKEVKENYITEDFHKLVINDLTSIEYSPGINLIKINHKGGVVIIPGAARVLNFLFEARQDFATPRLNKIHDAHE